MRVDASSLDARDIALTCHARFASQCWRCAAALGNVGGGSVLVLVSNWRTLSVALASSVRAVCCSLPWRYSSQP